MATAHLRIKTRRKPTKGVKEGRPILKRPNTRKKTKLLYVRDIRDRCPKDNEAINYHRCADCEFKGPSWHIDKQGRPLKITIQCRYFIDKNKK